MELIKSDYIVAIISTIMLTTSPIFIRYVIDSLINYLKHNKKTIDKSGLYKKVS